MFTAPKRFLAGETESGCLSLHNLEPPAHVFLELLSPSSSGTSAEDEVLARTSGVVETGKSKFLLSEHILRSINIRRSTFLIKLEDFFSKGIKSKRIVSYNFLF